MHPAGKSDTTGAPIHQELVPEEIIPAFSSFFNAFCYKYLKLQYIPYSRSIFQGEANHFLGVPFIKGSSYLKYCMAPDFVLCLLEKYLDN